MSETPLFFPSTVRFQQWLRKNHSRPDGAWILIAKKGTRPGMHDGDALEEALCWGWVDGRLHAHDERYFALWLSPRRPKSIWLLANRRAAERLIAEGRLQLFYWIGEAKRAATRARRVAELPAHIRENRLPGCQSA
ncbi:MAG: hypothetical protein NT005_08070 [Spirochaetes bacterium]|nr:hypothetical protein [Spirochaetota bacterium]